MKTETIEKLLNLTKEEKCGGICLSSDGEVYIGWDTTLDDFTGEYKVWYYNGQLHVHSNYKNGKKHGEYKIWHQDGQLCVHSHYKNGKFHGERKWWYSDGTLYRHELFENNKMIKDYLK